MKTFWKHVALGFIKVAKASKAAALWASQHPQVLAEVAALSGNPAVVAGVGAVTSVLLKVEPPPTPKK